MITQPLWKLADEHRTQARTKRVTRAHCGFCYIVPMFAAAAPATVSVRERSRVMS